MCSAVSLSTQPVGIIILYSLCKILAQQKEQFCCHQTRFLGSNWSTNVFAAGAGGAYSVPPDLLAGLKGPISKGKGWGWDGRGGERRGKERGGEGKGRERGEGECLTSTGGIEGPEHFQNGLLQHNSCTKTVSSFCHFFATFFMSFHLSRFG